MRDQYDLDKIEHFLRKAIMTDKIAYNGENIVATDHVPDKLEGGTLTESMAEIKQIEKVILKEELQAGKEAMQDFCLFLYQNNKSVLADGYLRKLGYEWKLATNILAYPLSMDYVSTNEVESRTATTSTCNIGNHTNYLHVCDNALPLSAIQHLQLVFRPESPFWSEHQYDSLSNSSRTVGYFSYLYPFRDRNPSTTIEQIIDYLYPKIVLKFPNVKDCNIGRK